MTTPKKQAHQAHVPSQALHVEKTSPVVDLLAAEKGAAILLRALGVDIDAGSLRLTPHRMVKAYVELFTPRPFELTTFPNDEGYDELILVRDIRVHSICEHHFLPFVGVAHIAYIPDGRILGLSKLARVAEHFARRPQVQERLTRQIADWLSENLDPKGVGVVMRMEHSCMGLRGAQAAGSSTVTSALLGRLRTDARTRQEFLAMAAPQ